MTYLDSHFYRQCFPGHPHLHYHFDCCFPVQCFLGCHYYQHLREIKKGYILITYDADADIHLNLPFANCKAEIKSFSDNYY